MDAIIMEVVFLMEDQEPNANVTMDGQDLIVPPHRARETIVRAQVKDIVQVIWILLDASAMVHWFFHPPNLPLLHPLRHTVGRDQIVQLDFLLPVN